MATKTTLTIAAVLAGLSAAAIFTGNPLTWFESPAATGLYTRWLPPQVPSAATTAIEPQEREALGRLPLRGRIVWSSNRSGNHELYLAELGGEVKQLTSNPHVDYFSRFSPDGERILFLRSQRPWVSFREPDAWDLYVMNVDGTGERRLAAAAYNPTWTPDGSAILFLHDNRLVRYTLSDDVESVLHEGAARPTEATVYDPQLGESGLLALTLRNSARDGVGVLDMARSTYRTLGQGCNIAWVPGSSTLVWVESRGAGGTRIIRAESDGGGLRTLIDLPGSYSHEYFPRPSNDGRWLIWGASEGGHEHDRADYEIFVWEMGSPWDTAVRITFSPANDQWPDLFVTGTVDDDRPRP